VTACLGRRTSMVKRALAGEPKTPRQREFVAAAARLFSARGYHAVGINDISAELGLSGPAIYRHYPSKEALLIAVFDEVITSHLEELRDIVSSGSSPRETLDAIVDHHIELAYGETENMVTWRTEFRSLPAADRHRLRYLRPDLTDDQVRACCRAAIAILQSPTEFHSPLGRQELTPLLRRMAIAALLAEPDDAVASA
jgi:AcrR family transcriptional regulator